MKGEEKMNTVKHYKDFGLEFVVGDSCNDRIGNEYSRGGWVAAVNGDSSSRWSSDEITEFAWRKNTGEEPQFRGEIEAKTEYTTTECFAGDLYWSVNALGAITKWRPLLTQPKPQQEKQIFTQEMADANALVPLGAKFIAFGTEWNCVGEHYLGGVIGESALHGLCRFECSDCHPLKTQRDIEIDLIQEILLKYSENALDQCELHDLGYRVTKTDK